ncbi:ARG3 [Sanghuangporus weigelae]
MSLPKRLMTLADLSPSQIQQIIGVARRLKTASRRVLPPTGPTLREAAWKESETNPTKLSAPPQSLRNTSIALLFSKRSTRTRVSAETAAQLLGGQAIFLGKDDIQLGVNESARDTARILSGMCQGIFARVGDHSEIEELAKYAEVPVINALSSLWHPTQVLADLQTLMEEKSLQKEATPTPNPHSIPYSSASSTENDSQTPSPEISEASNEQQQTEAGASEKPSNAVAAQHRVAQARRRLRPLTIAYVGDSANVLHDMLVTYPRLGHKLQVASPPDPRYRAPTAVWDKVVELGCDKDIEWTADPREAVKGADVVITDTWISMGQEAEYEQRVKDFQGYQVTEELCEAAKENWKFLHCLPRKSHEVNDEVFYGPRSLVFREADNRKWTIMALFHLIFGGGSFSALPHGKPRGVYQPSWLQQDARPAGKNLPQNLSVPVLRIPSKLDAETRFKLGLSDQQASDVARALNAIRKQGKITLQVLPYRSKTNDKKPQDGDSSSGAQKDDQGNELTGEELLSSVQREVEASKQLRENMNSAAKVQRVQYKPSSELGTSEDKESA